ncbi:MAG: NAD(P)-binding protein [Polyangiaceae bacterium]|nr:NAD(P)-binding protein [Polyangiaceae bacterium]
MKRSSKTTPSASSLPSPLARTRVAIVGGGCASLAAAFELTRPNAPEQFEVTVYQMGHRLGGKGASGRGSSGRIEEHGLHLWLGFYENAFRLMREAYAEAARDPATCPIATFNDAFKPDPNVAVAERLRGGDWLPWVATFPPAPGLPGDPAETVKLFSVREYLIRAVRLVASLIESAGKSTHLDREPAPAPPEGIWSAIDKLLRYGALATATALREAFDLLLGAISTFAPRSENVVLKLIDAVSEAVKQQLQTLIEADRELYRVFGVVDLVLAILRGCIRFGLAFDPRGFDAINDVDWRDWLRDNGATQSSVDSAFVRGIYDLVFAYEDGDTERPRLAAGVALRGAMRMFFTYKGALFWKMQAGMGDIVFSPLYEVLKQRGVKFEFFHKLTHVGLGGARGTPDDRHVAALEFDVQAEIVGGGEYQPLVEVAGLPCWPSQPLWGQLKNGDALQKQDIDLESPFDPTVLRKKTLRVSQDFDFVILGLSVGALPLVCKEILAEDTRFRRAIHSGKSVQTQAFQLWLREDMAQLGWRGDQTNLSAFVEPFDTWADMTHLIDAEDWVTPPKAIAYFCSVLPERKAESAGDAKAAHQVVRNSAVEFLRRDVVHLWPRFLTPSGEPRWNLLAAEPNKKSRKKSVGEEQFDTQFWTANVRPSDRYALSLPGTIADRISPLERSYDNLTFAGDWTASGLCSGCVESAVMSGMLASHALSGFPALHSITGYDHP